jgi:hypothetical protein
MAFNYSPKVITDGLVLYLDAANRYSYVSGTTWNDISRGGNNGTLVNGPTFNSANGGSIVFDGTDDSCRSILNSQLSNSFTFSTFTKPTTIAIASVPPIGIASYGNYWAFLGLYLGKWHWALYDGGVNPYIISNAVPTTSWVHITGVRDVVADTLYLYVNGVLDSTLNDTTTTVPVYSAFTIGGQVSQPFGQNRLYNGSIANTQIYNRALSAAEVLQNYNATKTRFGL